MREKTTACLTPNLFEHSLHVIQFKFKLRTRQTKK
ncbi:unnamed protein product [Tenebrio molitor]|nr:unnamed protein product [Tenebrio molitor]